MSLYRIETQTINRTQRMWIRDDIMSAVADVGADVVEAAQWADGDDRLVFVVEHHDEVLLEAAIQTADTKAKVSEVHP